MGKEASVQLQVQIIDRCNEGLRIKPCRAQAFIWRLEAIIFQLAYRVPTVFISWNENKSGSFKWCK
jgi:hypothetical protein